MRVKVWFPHNIFLIIKRLQQQRHTGMDSHQAILPDALRVNANLFQTDLCRFPDTMDVMFISLPWHLVPAIHAGTTSLLD
jgi:hypothetical protein